MGHRVVSPDPVAAPPQGAVHAWGGAMRGDMMDGCDTPSMLGLPMAACVGGCAPYQDHSVRTTRACMHTHGMHACMPAAAV